MLTGNCGLWLVLLSPSSVLTPWVFLGVLLSDVAPGLTVQVAWILRAHESHLWIPNYLWNIFQFNFMFIACCFIKDRYLCFHFRPSVYLHVYRYLWATQEHILLFKNKQKNKSPVQYSSENHLKTSETITFGFYIQSSRNLRVVWCKILLIKEQPSNKEVYVAWDCSSANKQLGFAIQWIHFKPVSFQLRFH